MKAFVFSLLATTASAAYTKSSHQYFRTGADCDPGGCQEVKITADNNVAISRGAIQNVFGIEMGSNVGWDGITNEMFYANVVNGARTLVALSSGAVQSCTVCDNNNYAPNFATFGQNGCNQANCKIGQVGATCQLTCDPIKDCAKVDGTKWAPGIVAGNNFHPSRNNACTVTGTPNKCSCGLNQDPAQNCIACMSGYTNYPWCNHRDADFVKLNVCSNQGTPNANYIYKSAQTQCGVDTCGPTEQCCQTPTKEYRANGHPASDNNDKVVNLGKWWVAARAADENRFCADKQYTCCGTKVCTRGRKCFDAGRSICLTDDQTHDWEGLNPCYGGPSSATGAYLSDGVTLRTWDALPTTWCNGNQQCCDGVCCHKSHACDSRGRNHRTTDNVGWDLLLRNSPWSLNTNNLYSDGAKFCNYNPFNGFHAMRIIVIPLFLTFAYLLTLVLGLQSGAPGPIKILCLVTLILNILQAYSHYWRMSVFVSVIAGFTMWAQSNADAKPSWSSAWITIVHFILLATYFGLGSVFLFWQPGTLVAPAVGSNLFPPLRNHNRFVDCYNEFRYFYTDHRSLSGLLGRKAYSAGTLLGYGGASYEDWGTAVTSGDLDSGLFLDVTYATSAIGMPGGSTSGTFSKNYFGYCAVGWLGALEFFHALQGFLLIALAVFTFKANFGSDGSTGARSNKIVAQEVEVP